MSEIQRSPGPSTTSGASPTHASVRLEPAVRFSPEAEGSPGQGRLRRAQDRLTPRPQSWFGAMRLSKDTPQAPTAKPPAPLEPSSAQAASPTLASASKKPASLAQPRGKSADDSVVRRLGYKAGPLARPAASYWVGREAVTHELEDWIETLTNHAAFLGDKNAVLGRRNADLEVRLKTAEQSVQALQKHMATADEHLDRVQAQSAFFEQFYAGHQNTCEELAELFQASRDAAQESQNLAERGFALAERFKRPVAMHVASESGDISGSDADSELGTFGG